MTISSVFRAMGRTVFSLGSHRNTCSSQIRVNAVSLLHRPFVSSPISLRDRHLGIASSHRQLSLMRFFSTAIFSTKIKPHPVSKRKKITTEMRYPSGLTVKTFVPPPKGFDPLKADDATLLKYGLPARPKGDPQRIKIWERIMEGPLNFIEPVFRRIERRQDKQIVRKLVSDVPPDLGTTTDSRWSGAVVFTWDAPIKSISAEWITPYPNPASSAGNLCFSAAWVGIDGISSNGYPSQDVLQAGVESDFNKVDGVKRYIYAWWCWYPDGPMAIDNFPVAAGDVITCYVEAFSNKQGTFLMKNQTTGAITSTLMNAPRGTKLDGNCAEWIVELPGETRVLTNYGEVIFKNCLATKADGSTLQPKNGETINMVVNGKTVSTVTLSSPNTVNCVYTGPIVGPFQKRIFEKATMFVNETDGTWLMADYDKDGIPDLVFIKTSNTPSGRVEVHIASGASKYEQPLLRTPTMFGGNETDATWLLADCNGDGIPDLVCIKTKNTSSGHVEVYIASGASKYQHPLLMTATMFGNESNGTWLLAKFKNSGKLPDLVYIKNKNTSTGRVEVHIATGDSEYQKPRIQTPTMFGNESNGTWLLTDYNGDGIPDLVYIKTQNTSKGLVEVHVASGALNYQKPIVQIPTTFGNESNGTWLMADYNRDGTPDLVYIKTNNTPNNHVEVHVANGKHQD